MKIRPFISQPIFAATIIFITLMPQGIAADRYGRRPGNVANIQEQWSLQTQQGFSLKFWLNNSFMMGHTAFNNGIIPPGGTCGVGIGLEYPPGSCMEHLYGAGPWIGGIVDGERKVTEGYNGYSGRGYFIPEQKDTLRNRFWSTGMGTGYTGPKIRGFDDDHDGRIDEDDLDGLDNDGDWIPGTDDLGADGLPDSLEHGCKGAYDPVRNPDPAFDNYEPAQNDPCHPNPNGTFPKKSDRNKYTQSNGIPDHGEPHVDEDFGAVSMNDLSCSATDTFRYPVYFEHHPLGVKTTLRSHAWSQPAGEAIVINEYEFVNVGNKVIHDAYLAFFADADVGPVAASGYANHNYAAFDHQTKTAYVNNPVDRGSTPFGVTWLGSAGDAPSSKFVFQYWELGSAGDPQMNDSLIYRIMDGEGHSSDSLIFPDQSADKLNDARIFISNGPITSFMPGDTIRMTLALVSGNTVDEMLQNARRAHQIFRGGYILPPIVSVQALGQFSATFSWEAAVSPYGDIAAYRLYYGEAPGQYTDSLFTTDRSATVSNLLPGQQYYFSVRALDATGRWSGFADEGTNTPPPPRDLTIIDEERSIHLSWSPVTPVANGGYNVYRRSRYDTSEIAAAFQKINAAVVSSPAYIDKDVWGDQTYYYYVVAVGANGVESGFFNTDSGHLLPPSPPNGFVIGPGKTFLHLAWEPNREKDLMGYNVFRSDFDPGRFVQLNSALLHTPEFIDSAVLLDSNYYYFPQAVDSTGAVSPPAGYVLGWTALFNRGILVLILESSGYTAAIDSIKKFYTTLLNGRQFQVIAMSSPGVLIYPAQLARYSSIILVADSVTASFDNLPGLCKAYLLGGGKMLFNGRLMNAIGYPRWHNFFAEQFDFSSVIPVSSARNFIGATGWNDFPSISVDPLRFDALNHGINYIEQFPGVPPERALYTYHSSPYDSTVDGKTVGMRDRDSGAYLLSFPLHFLDRTSAAALMNKVLFDFGPRRMEFLTDVPREIPQRLRLYDAYPNPFNPATTIRYDLPAPGYVSITVYDILGRPVARLAEGYAETGAHKVVWDASRCSSGVYFYRIAVIGAAGNRDEFSKINKVVLLR